MSWQKGLAYSLGIIGGGYLLMRYTTPTPDQLYNALSPELKEEADKRRKDQAHEQAELMQLLRRNMAADQPVWKVQPPHPESKNDPPANK
ncbi:assembly factor cbp4 [Dimargaris cristalligena]|nr:assembly factor cbp4 [Dimargaris cristalligena]